MKPGTHPFALLAAAVWLFPIATAEAARAERPREIDYLEAAVDFAKCMIAYGRDRYGEVHSPLFAVLLTREKKPEIGPYPLFADPNRQAGGMNTPFKRFDFNKLLNYPEGLEDEGPHKVTLYGCDPYEDRDLYSMLIDLTRITGNPKYKQEAEKALTWWFKNTQGPTGLYPWGEHMGWDLQYDCPTYFEGPSKHLYAACYHEVKDSLPFLDILARLPAENPGDPTPLEKYALGIWEAHFWDKEKAYFCRHGDYTGEDDRHGSTGGFPAHLAAYFHVWATACLDSKNPDFRKKIEGVFDKVLDMAIARTEKWGFFPFTFDPELRGRNPGKSAPVQAIRLAHHALDVGLQMEKANLDVAAKLRRLAKLHLGSGNFENSLEHLEMYKKTGDRTYLENTKTSRAEADSKIKDLSQDRAPSEYAGEIIRHVESYKQHRDKAYLDAAGTHARLAYLAFCDDTSPLPKARPGSGHRTTLEGKPFHDFYFRGAKLMHAFALLGEALRDARKSP